MKLDCDVPTITDFLNAVSAREYYHLCKINPRKENSKAIGYVASTLEEAIDWIVESNANGFNVYDQWNFPDRAFDRRAKREHIRWLAGFHCDIDLPAGVKDRQRWLDDTADKMMEFGKPHIIMSGNGLQARWPFAKYLKRTAATEASVEDINKRLIAFFGAGSGTWESNRLLRVPGTINYPNASKKKKGFRAVLAELWEITTETFTFDDFAGLPAAPASKGIESKASQAYRIDYAKKEYTPGYKPITYDDLLKIDPDIEDFAHERAEKSDNRSDLVYGFIMDCIRAVCDETRTFAKDRIDDTNFYKNISDLVSDCGMPFLERYDEKGWKLLGYDVHRATCDAAESRVGPTDRGRTRAEKRREAAERADKGAGSLTLLECRKGFLDHVEGCMELSALPNCVFARDVAVARQSATESNVRAVLDAAGIIARWDVMRDRAEYSVSPQAGAIKRKGDDAETRRRDRISPKAYFDGAFARTGPDMLTTAQESLIADALHQKGMGQRSELPKLLEVIAKETRFHPIESYCTRTPWDGVDRIAQIADCIESDHPLKERYVRLFFRQCVAAVKSLQRALAVGDGLQISGVVVLEGKQYLGKSTFWRRVTPAGFLASSQGGLQLGTNKETDSKRECLSGLVAILDEIGGSMARSEAEALKNFLTGTYDEFRVSYGRVPVSKPRMTVFVGTTNNLVLKDPTGSRRYWVLKVTGLDFAQLDAITGDDGAGLQQVYAQAWHEVMNDGAQWWLTPDEDKIRARLNAAHQLTTEEEEGLDAYLNAVGDRHVDYWVTKGQILDLLGIRFKAAHKIKAIGDLLQLEGYDYRTKVRVNGYDYRNVFRFPVLPERFKMLVGE